VPGQLALKQQGTVKRLALMEYDIRPHDEAYDATISGILIVLMVVVTVLLVIFPS
jgi:hypothetical protein